MRQYLKAISYLVLLIATTSCEYEYHYPEIPNGYNVDIYFDSHFVVDVIESYGYEVLKVETDYVIRDSSGNVLTEEEYVGKMDFDYDECVYSIEYVKSCTGLIKYQHEHIHICDIYYKPVILSEVNGNTLELGENDVDHIEYFVEQIKNFTIEYSSTFVIDETERLGYKLLSTNHQFVYYDIDGIELTTTKANPLVIPQGWDSVSYKIEAYGKIQNTPSKVHLFDIYFKKIHIDNISMNEQITLTDADVDHIEYHIAMEH